MAARSGMITLITRLRRLTEAGTADYTLADETYWSDNHLQDELDMEKSIGVELSLAPIPQYVAGTSIYKLYSMPDGATPFEQPEGGPTVFKLTDSGGTAISTALFSVDEWNGLITFAADQAGSARYWTGYHYDIIKAASTIWNTKAGHAWTAIDFSADGQRFTRSVLHKHAVEMRDYYTNSRGLQVVALQRADQAPIKDVYK